MLVYGEYYGRVYEVYYIIITIVRSYTTIEFVAVCIVTSAQHK